MTSKKPKVSPRLFLKGLHTWTGLVAGLVIAVISLAGSVIVFRSEIQQASAPRSAAGPRSVGLDELARQIAQVHPDARVSQIRFPAKPGDVYIVQVDLAGKKRRLACDASTGRVLGMVDAQWVDWLIDLHRNLLAGKTGRKAVGVVGVILFTLSASGMLLWLSGRRKWRSWISVRPQGGSSRFHFELHRCAGLWAYGLLTVISFTGIELAYPNTFRDTLQWVTGQRAASKTPRVAKSAVRVTLPLDAYLRIGAGAMPDGVPTELRLPEGNKGPVDLRLYRRGDLADSGNHVYIEPSTGRVLAVSRAADQPLATRILASFAPIHYGEFGGLPIKMLWSLLGLVPSLLFITGLITWWRPKQRRPPSVVRNELAVERSPQTAGR